MKSIMRKGNMKITVNSSKKALDKFFETSNFQYCHTQCYFCGFASVVNIHHIKSKSEGGTCELDNLIPLCPNHHSLLHKFELSAELFYDKEVGLWVMRLIDCSPTYYYPQMTPMEAQIWMKKVIEDNNKSIFYYYGLKVKLDNDNSRIYRTNKWYCDNQKPE